MHLSLLPLSTTLWFLFASLVAAAPTVSLVSNTVLDQNGIFFVSYDGVVNVNSFQLSAVLTYANYQFAAWYTSSRAAVLARRQLPSGAWATLQLPHQLSTSDSHNVIALGVSPADGRIHVAMDCHSTQVYYTSSETGLATSGASWDASRFGAITTTLGTLNIGSTITYPQFVVTPDNLLQFVYRSGVSGNGATQLAEYSGGKWTNVGSWASASGTYTSTNGVTSSARNLYIHGFTYRLGRLHVTGTWREQAGGVSCSSGGLTNHDTIYFYSDDKGRTWKNNVGSNIGTSGSSPVNVNTGGIVVDSLNADHGLMNQESQDVDSAGQLHAIISYVPGRFTQCVTNYENDRIAYARPFHLYRSSNGSWTKVEIPFAINAVGRSQIVMDSSDNVYVVLPYVRIVTASKASGWTDWTMAYDAVAAGLNAFGEVTVDRARVASGVLSVLYQVKSTGTTPSAVRLVDFRLNGPLHAHHATNANAKIPNRKPVRRQILIFVSGTTSIDLETGRVAHPDSAHDQARAVFAEIVRAVEGLGGTRGDVVRVRMFVTRDEDSGDVGRALKEAFGEVGPAATMILGAKFVDRDMRVEIEADAVVEGIKFC